MVVTGRRVRFTAVVAGVVLALTGFSSSGGSHGKSSGHDGGGGGCSSSKSRKHTSHDSDNDNSGTTGTTGGSNGGTATPTPTKSPGGRGTVVTCAGPGRAEAVVEVTSTLTTTRLLSVPVTFKDAGGATVEKTSALVTLKPGETQRVTVKMVNPARAADVRACEIGRIE